MEQEELSVNQINQLRGNYNKLVEQCKELQKENIQYKKALTEISKIYIAGCVKDSRCSEFYKVNEKGGYVCCNQCVSYAVQSAESALNQ